MFNFISIYHFKKTIFFITILLLVASCNNNEHIFDIIDQAQKIEINSWDQFSQNQFKYLLDKIKDKGFSENAFEKLALISLMHGELPLSKTILAMLSEKSLAADFDYYLAEIAIQEEQYDVADKIIKRGLSKANISDKIIFYLLRIDMLMSLGELNKAQDTLNHIFEVSSENLAAQYLQSKLYLLIGNCKDAIISLKNLITKLPQYTQLYSPLASAYRMCGELELADKYSQQHTSEVLQFPNRFTDKKQSVGNPVASLKNDIKASISQRNYKSAIKDLLLLIKIEPNEARNYLNLGSMYYKLGEVTKAEHSYQKAYNLNPKNIKASVNLGIVNMALANYPEAEFYFNKALEIYPFHLKATLNLASIKLSMNLPNEAENLLLGLLQRNSSNTSVQKGLIVSLCMQEKYEKAFQKISEWINLEPDSQILLALYAQLLLQNYDADLTSVTFIQNKLLNHVKQYPRLVELYVLLEIKNKKLQKLDDAFKIYEKIMGEKLNSQNLQKLSQRFNQLKNIGYLGIEIFNE